MKIEASKQTAKGKVRGLISPIPGVEAVIENIQALQGEIKLIEKQQANVILDLDLQIARARAVSDKSLLDSETPPKG